MKPVVTGNNDKCYNKTAVNPASSGTINTTSARLKLIFSSFPYQTALAPYMGSQDGNRAQADSSFDVEAQGCCSKEPFFSNHSITEAGGSHYAPSWMMMFYRFLGSFACLGVGLYLGLVPVSYTSGGVGLRLGSAHFFFVASFIAFAFAYFLLAICSFMDARGKQSERFPKFVLFFLVQTVFYSVYWIPTMVILAVLGNNFALVFVLPWALYLIDVILIQSRMHPRIMYIFPASIILIVYATIEIIVAFATNNPLAIRHPLAFITLAVAYTAGTFLLTSLVLSLTRLQYCCHPRNTDSH